MATRSGHPGPAISYDEAMAMLIDDPETGTKIPVKSCHATLFRQTVYRACEASPKSEALKVELGGLLYRFMPDRFFAINVMAKYGVEFPGKQHDE